MDGKFVYKLYDKRDLFPFFIVRRPHADSDTPNNIFYSAFVGETLRTASSVLHFLPKVHELVSRLLRQGSKVRKCYSSLKKLIKKHQESFSKFDDDVNYLLRQIFSKRNKTKIILMTLYLFISISTNIFFIYFFGRRLGVTN